MEPASTLPLAASLALLLTKEDGGKAVAENAFDAGIAGAVLTDLALREIVVLRDKKVLPHTSTQLPEDPVLAGVVAQIRAEPKERSARWWVSKLSGKDLSNAVRASLVDSGVLTRVDKKVLGIFPSTIYPEADGRTEQALREQLAHVLSEAVPPTPASASIIALLDATSGIRSQFGPVPRPLVKSVIAANWAAPAVKAVIQEVQTVMIGAIVATTVATSSS